MFIEKPQRTAGLMQIRLWPMDGPVVDGTRRASQPEGYLSQNGADTGTLFMSLIYTCEFCRATLSLT